MKAFGATIHGYLSLTLHSWGASSSLFPLNVNSKWSVQSGVVWLHVLRGTFSSFFVSFLNWWNLWSSIFLQIPRFPMLVLAHYLLKISKQGQDWILGPDLPTLHISEIGHCVGTIIVQSIKSGLLTKMFTVYSYLVSPCTCDYKTFVSSSGGGSFACNLPPSSCYMCFLVSALNRSVDINWRLDSSKDLSLITWKVPFILPETSNCMLWSALTSSKCQTSGKISKGYYHSRCTLVKDIW
jgi:hypothetical protein